MKKESNNIYIYGRKPIEEILLNEPNKVDKIFIKDTVKISDIDSIASLASKNKIPFAKVPAKKISDLVGEVNDQGAVASISGALYLELNDWLSQIDMKDNPAVVLLDEVEDPHNFGAIVRSAASAGAGAVIIGTHRQAPVSATVYKTSAGMISRLPIIRVGNLNDSIAKLKKAGFWIVGLDGRADKNLWEQDFKMPSVIIVGSEGEGIRQKTLEACDFRISIPMKKGIESLNASVAAALVIYEWRHQNI